MKAPLELLEEKFKHAARRAFPDLGDIAVEITQSTQEKFGHYQCNSAMKLAKELKANPRAIAKELIKHIDSSGEPFIANLEIAGPGFINITLEKSYLEKFLHLIITDEHLGIDKPAHKQRVIVEFSSPNIAKEMHVGHLRSTIIGDCLARLFEFLGHDTLRINHIGDWGTAFGMLIAYMKEYTPAVLTGEEETDLPHLMQWYRESKKKFDADPDFKKRGQLQVVSLQSGEPEAMKAWQVICDISRKAYQEIYDLLDIKLTEKGESFYQPFLKPLVDDLENRGVLEISDGAKCLFVEGFKGRDGNTLPLMIQKSDGGFPYDATDMAAIRYRIEEEKVDRIIYVVDAGQGLHFQMVFKGAEIAGYLDRNKITVEHVPFGLVLGQDGKKFRTRSGETERLIDLLNTAIEKADEILKERDPSLSEKERKERAHILGISAIKYADLSCHRTGDYTFSYERMLRFEGNTAAFLLYAYVRVAGIKRKIKIDIESIKNEPITLSHPSEVSLALHLVRFDEALEQVTKDLLPNRLTDYLYNLAEKFHAFYRDCQVEGTPEQNSRLLLCEAVTRTMKQGLHILGIETLEKM